MSEEQEKSEKMDEKERMSAVMSFRKEQEVGVLHAARGLQVNVFIMVAEGMSYPTALALRHMLESVLSQLPTPTPIPKEDEGVPTDTPS